MAISLSALLVFPLYFLRSFAYAGIGVTLVAAATSVVALPALLAVLGRRVDSLRLFGREGRDATAGTGFWHRTAERVMRRPVLVSAVAIGILLVLGAPFLGVRFGTPDERVLPTGDPARQATERLRSDFASDEAEAFPVVLTPVSAGPGPTDLTGPTMPRSTRTPPGCPPWRAWSGWTPPPAATSTGSRSCPPMPPWRPTAATVATCG